MLSIRVAYGLLRGLRTFWLAWSAAGLAVAWLVWPAGGQTRAAVLSAFSAPLISLIVHEYGHARVALARGAVGLRLVRVSASVAVSHEPMDVLSTALIAAGGPLLSVVGALGLFWVAWAMNSAAVAVLAVIVGAAGLSVLPWAHDGRAIWSSLLALSRVRRSG